MATDSAYAPVTSHLADVLDEPIQTSPSGRWRIGFYLEPPMEHVIEEKDRAGALKAFDRMGYGEQAQIVYLEPEKEDRET